MVLEYVKQLHENELWSNLVQLAPFALSFCRSQSPDLTSKSKQQILVYVADAFFEGKEFQRAESLYKEALQVKKEQQKAKKTSSVNDKNQAEECKATSDVEVRYKMHLCYLRTNQHSMAVDILQSIPVKQRTPKVYQALGKVYQQAGMERPAVTCFREVLKSCPLALEAAQTLMMLGVKAKDIQSLALEATSNPSSDMDWFNQWIQAFTAFGNKEYVVAMSKLKALEERPILRNNIHLLITIGLCQHYNGNHSAALATLQRVHRLEPTNLRGMDVFASLLAKERKHKELESLATKLMAVTEEAPEPWIATGYHCYAAKKGTRAVYFAHRACMLQHRHVEALLLKGNVLLSMKKLQDSMNHFREAVLIAPYRYETHKGLVDCYLDQSRHREAVSVATAACKALNNSPRSLTLLATVLIKDPLQLSTAKAKPLVEKALKADSNHLPAVYLMAKIHEQEMNLEGAIELLRKQLATHSTCKLHLMLADLLGKTHDEEKAMDHYAIALNLNPRNIPAQEGLQKLEQATDTISDRTYDMDMDEMNSDDADLEESETEAVWSDGDLNLAATSNASF